VDENRSKLLKKKGEIIFGEDVNAPLRFATTGDETQRCEKGSAQAAARM
jgi:hypothetical protein